MSARVTCVVPVHDGAEHLPAALDSILAQTVPALEVLVVDDGSSDGSGAVAAAYGTPVRVLRLERRSGAGVARATAVAEARGGAIAFLDADDLWRPEKLELQLGHLEGPPALDVSMADVENFWEQGDEEERRWRAQGRVRGTGIFSAVMARREVFDRVALAGRHRHSDLAAWIVEVRDVGLTVGRLEQVLTDRRRHAGNRTVLEHDAVFDEWFELLRQRVARRRGGA